MQLDDIEFLRVTEMVMLHMDAFSAFGFIHVDGNIDRDMGVDMKGG